MYFISGFYKFKKISKIKKNKKVMQAFFINRGIRGSIIISKEGINGTISAKKKVCITFLAFFIFNIFLNL